MNTSFHDGGTGIILSIRIASAAYDAGGQKDTPKITRADSGIPDLLLLS